MEEEKKQALDSKKADKLEKERLEEEEVARVRVETKGVKKAPKKSKDAASMKFMQSILKSYGKPKKEDMRRLEDDLEEKLQKEENKEDWDAEDMNPNHKFWAMESGDEDQPGDGKVATASGIDDALKLLAGKEGEDKIERHPEKRMKHAWRNYVEERLPELGKEFPHFKRGKLLYMMREDWQKAPENPMNRAHVKYNEKLEG